VSTPDAVIAGRYRLVGRVAAGGMGTVWEGWDERLRRPVAIKQLHPQPGLSDAAAEMVNNRAMREARITARLHHPHAITVYDVVEHDGQPCLIMQYLPSTSLQATLNDRSVLPPIEVARIGAEIASALAAAHRAGIVHRDVKPGNVLIAEDGAANITDFGISHALGDVALTSTGMVTGTPAYLSPEVARGSESTFAADVFSLGATLYAAVEGAPPFGTDENPMATLHKVASGQVIPPHRAGPLGPLLTRMLAADPGARPAMIDVARTLAALHADASAPHTIAMTQTLASPPASGRAAAPNPPPPVALGSGNDAADARTRRVAPAAAAGAGLAALGLARSAAGSGSGATREPAAVAGGVPPRFGGPGAGHAPVPDPGGNPAGRTGGSAGIDSDTGSGHRGVLAAAIAVVAVLLLVGLAFATGLIGGGSGSGRNNTPSAAGQGGTATSRTSSSAGASSGKSSSLRSSTVPSSSAPSSTVPSSTVPSSTVPSSSAPSSTVPSSSAPSSTVPSSSARSSSVKPSTVPSSSAPSNAGVGGTPSGAQLAAAISGYYALLPDNTDGGWSRLTSRYQTDHAGGRANYNSFWDAVERVSVSNVVGLPPSAAEADITYVAKDGHVTRERTSFGLVSEGGVFKIDTSTVLSSQSG
jgi:hypothetical protein